MCRRKRDPDAPHLDGCEFSGWVSFIAGGNFACIPESLRCEFAGPVGVSALGEGGGFRCSRCVDTIRAEEIGAFVH
jgi:hypothetical protein